MIDERREASKKDNKHYRVQKNEEQKCSPTSPSQGLGDEQDEPSPSSGTQMRHESPIACSDTSKNSVPTSMDETKVMNKQINFIILKNASNSKEILRTPFEAEKSCGNVFGSVDGVTQALENSVQKLVDESDVMDNQIYFNTSNLDENLSFLFEAENSCGNVFGTVADVTQPLENSVETLKNYTDVMNTQSFENSDCSQVANYIINPEIDAFIDEQLMLLESGHVRNLILLKATV